MVHNLTLPAEPEGQRRQRKRSKKPSYSSSYEELANNNKVQVREQVAFQPGSNITSGPVLSDNFKASLYQLLAMEIAYHPRTEYLFNNLVCEDKVDASMRDEAMVSLRFLHKFHNLAPECFAHAVNMTDRFLARVKVKPKYMACLATAAYLIGAKMIEKREDWPPLDKLVRMARCGGSPSDLQRMEAIIRAKLRPGAAATGPVAKETAGTQASPAADSLESAVTPLHFLTQLSPLFPSEAAFHRAVGLLETCLCSVAMYCYRPALLAWCVARRYLGECREALTAMETVARILELSPTDLPQCSAAVEAASSRGLRSRGGSRRAASAASLSWPGLRRHRYSSRSHYHQRLQQQLGTIAEEQEHQRQRQLLITDEDCSLTGICLLFDHDFF